MKNIKNYELFLESIKTLPLIYSTKLKELFKMIDNPITNKLLDIENDVDNKKDFTLIDITDKDNSVSFIQVNRIVNTLGEEDIDKNLEVVTSDSNHTLWKKQRSEIAIGRFVNKVLTDFPSKELPIFVNLYKSTFNKIYSSSSFELVKGDEIKKWYLVDNYQEKIGDLSNSCMRYKKCQMFFDIYTKNPEVCSLLILKRDNPNKIVGRALIWKLSTGEYYMDRIYCNYDSDANLFLEYAKENNMKIYDSDNREYMKVLLKKYDYKMFPYMDTFVAYYPKTYEITNEENSRQNRLRQTNGLSSSGQVYSNEFNVKIDSNDAVYCVDVQSWVPDDEAVFVESEGEYYLSTSDQIVYSDYLDKYILYNKSILSDIHSCSLPADEAIEFDYYCFIDNEFEGDYTHKNEIKSLINININGTEYLCHKSQLFFNVYLDKWLLKTRKNVKQFEQSVDIDGLEKLAEYLLKYRFSNNVLSRIESIYNGYIVQKTVGIKNIAMVNVYLNLRNCRNRFDITPYKNFIVSLIGDVGYLELLDWFGIMTWLVEELLNIVETSLANNKEMLSIFIYYRYKLNKV
jgi:hypothetical protein